MEGMQLYDIRFRPPGPSLAIADTLWPVTDPRNVQVYTS